jgi:hypothetical protein
MPARTSVEIDDAGLPRRIFHMLEQNGKSAGDVTVFLKNHVDYTMPDNPTAGGAKMKQHKYSLHRSPKSPFNINAFKRELDLSDGRKLRSRMNTRSIKQTNSYTPIFVQCCEGMAAPKWDNTTAKGRRVNIGSYDSKAFTLIYAVFAGPPSRRWTNPPYSRCKFREIEFEHFNLVVLPTFMTMPSVKVGFMVHPMSEDLEEYIDPPENPKRSNSGFFRGMDENQATEMFIFWSNRIKGWTLDQISGVPGCTPEALQRTQVALQFLASGDRQSPEYADFTKWCRQRSIEPMVVG